VRAVFREPSERVIERTPGYAMGRSPDDLGDRKGRGIGQTVTVTVTGGLGAA
jgi:hypothetical protein